MECPRCKETLEYKELDGEKIEVCHSCNGMWLDKHQLNHILKESGGDVEACSLDENYHEDVYPVINCRRCREIPMKKINFLDYSEIIMDYCPHCGGFWLDRDELAKMKDYIHCVEEGSHQVKNFSAYDLLVRLSRIAFSIFR